MSRTFLCSKFPLLRNQLGTENGSKLVFLFKYMNVNSITHDVDEGDIA